MDSTSGSLSENGGSNPSRVFNIFVELQRITLWLCLFLIGMFKIITSSKACVQTPVGFACF